MLAQDAGGLHIILVEGDDQVESHAAHHIAGDVDHVLAIDQAVHIVDAVEHVVWPLIAAPGFFGQQEDAASQSLKLVQQALALDGAAEAEDSGAIWKNGARPSTPTVDLVGGGGGDAQSGRDPRYSDARRAGERERLKPLAQECMSAPAAAGFPFARARTRQSEVRAEKRAGN
ncbi:MAG: hypothetical protein ACUVR3_04625 [Candidatus Roseilinea sp.]